MTEPVGIKPLSSFHGRANRVIDVAFGGEHHVGRIEWHVSDEKPGFAWCKFSVYAPNGLSSWDFDELTRLVVASHDECLRAAVRPMPRGLVVVLSERRRYGGDPLVNACPTLEAHVAAIRGGREAIRSLLDSMRGPSQAAPPNCNADGSNQGNYDQFPSESSLVNRSIKIKMEFDDE